MNTSKGWLIIEEYFHEGTISVVSIISPRKSSSYVREYVEQMYVDRFASINEKIAYNKNPKSSAFKIEKSLDKNSFSFGHDPTFRVYRCHKLSLKGNKLTYTYTYKVFKDEEGRDKPILNENTETINVT